MDTARTPEQFRADVRDGVRTGLGYAIWFSLIATVLLAIAARNGPAVEVAKFWLAVIVFYFVAGAAGGALYGWLRPVRDRLWGRLLTAYLILFLVYGGGTLAFMPLFESLNPDSQHDPVLFLMAMWAVICIFLAPVYVVIVRARGGT